MSTFIQAARPKGNFVKLKEKGDSITMEVVGYTEGDYIPYGETTPKLNKNGQPIQEQLIEGLDYSAESEDEARVILAVNKFNMKQAIGKALIEAGASDLLPGGILTVTYEGDGVATRPGAYPPKVFSATYQLPEPAENPWGSD